MSVQTRTTALQNEVVRLYCQFEMNGVLANPAAQPLVEVLDTDGVTVLGTITAQNEHTGIYFADWYVPANLPLGNYYDRWTFQWAPTASVTEMVMLFTVYGLESYVNFISPAISQNISDRVLQLMKDLSNDFIYEAQHIPVYFEQAMRMQQENQTKRVKQYYYFALDADKYTVEEGAVYFNNGQKFTVWETLVPEYPSSTSSESSSSSESVGNVSSSSSSSSSSSVDSLSSNSSSSQSSQSSNSSSSLDSSSSSSLDSSSSSSEPIVTTTTTTTPWVYQPTLTCVGTGAPFSSGTLTKISGNGPVSINFISYTVKTSRFSTIYNLAYNNWNHDPRPIVRVNNRIVDDGWFVDWNGKIFFDGIMAPEDSINVFYKFAYFSDEELLSFLNLSLQIMNSQPPASVYYPSIVTMPGEWNAPVLLYAAVTALKRLIFGLNFQEKMIIFGQPEQARQSISTFQQLYQDYSTLWQETAKNAKTRKLYGMSQLITPEYTLPGGRCCSATTYIDCKVGNKKQKITIKDAFMYFCEGKNISVLSLKKDGNIDYMPVGKIWESGRKKTFVLNTRDAQIRLTKEHLVYIPEENKYKPVMDLVVGDSIFVLCGKKLVEQKLLSDPKSHAIEEVYDIEVPETENFIGNNIVSHNSRWFRYLFKSGN